MTIKYTHHDDTLVRSECIHVCAKTYPAYLREAPEEFYLLLQDPKSNELTYYQFYYDKEMVGWCISKLMTLVFCVNLLCCIANGRELQRRRLLPRAKSAGSWSACRGISMVCSLGVDR